MPSSQIYKTSILFSSEEDFVRALATVALRPDEMVLDFPESENWGRYLIRGSKVQHYYAGTDEIPDAPPTDAIARWALLGNVFVGIWIEDGREYLFSFRLPAAATRPLTSKRAPRKRK